MGNEIIVNDNDDNSNVLEYIEITNSGTGTLDGGKDMLVISEYNPEVPVIRPPYTAEDVANKKFDLLNPNRTGYTSTIAVSNAVSLLLPISDFNFYSGVTIPDTYYNKTQVDTLISGGTSNITASNGLTKIGENIVLGGVLTGNTTVGQDSGASASFRVHSYGALQEYKVAGPFGIYSSLGIGSLADSISLVTHDGTNSRSIILNSGYSHISVVDNIGNFGFGYNADYSTAGEANDLWIPSWISVKKYADSSFAFENGLTETGNTVTLGGPILQDTVIGTVTDNFDFSILSYESTQLYQSTNQYGDVSGIRARCDLGETSVKLMATWVDGATSEQSIKLEPYAEYIHVIDTRGVGFKYDGNYISSDRKWIPTWGAVIDHLCSQDVNALVIDPTSGQTGYVIAWNNTNDEYELIANAGGGLSYRIESTGTTSYAEFGNSGADEFLTVKGTDASLIAEFLDDSDVNMFSIGQGGRITLSDTINNSLGVIYKDSVSFLHNFHHPTGDTAVPIGRNIFLGEDAGNFTLGSTATSTTEGSSNIGIGYHVLLGITSGYDNIGIGVYTLSSTNIGVQNIAIGSSTLRDNVDGLINVGIGISALRYNTSGEGNVAMGYYASRENLLGDNNTAIGRESLFNNNNGNLNVALGIRSGYSSLGSRNIFLGSSAGYYETSLNKLYISSIDYTEQIDEATARTVAIIYGVQSTTTTSQTLALNAQVSTPYALTVGTNLGYSTSEGLWFGDGDTGFYENIDDNFYLDITGNNHYRFLSTGFQVFTSVGAASGALVAVTPTNVVPSLLPKNSDTDTGIGSNANDALSFITGGLEAMRLSEANSHVLRITEIHVGITASITQTQGQGQLYSSTNEISVVANTNDVVTMYPAVKGLELTIINNGANTLQIFPANGDDLGAGVNVSITLDSGLSITFFAIDTVTWSQIATNSTGGVSEWTALTDTPSSYSGQSLNTVRVNIGETALEYGVPLFESADRNLAIGTGAGAAISTSDDGLFIGYNAGNTSAAGSRNTVIGSETGSNMGAGANGNILLGYRAGNYVAGNNNIIIGAFAADGIGFTGGNNTLVGGSALTAVTGDADNNTGIGSSSLGRVTSGNDNTAIGNGSGYGPTTASSGIFIGSYSGWYETGGDALLISSLTSVEQVDEATTRTKALIYGVNNTTTTSQTLALNAQVNVPYKLTVGTNLVYTSSEGLSFGAGDVVLYQPSANLLSMEINSVRQYQFNNVGFTTYNTGGSTAALIRAVIASSTLPNLIPNGSDTNTGIGSAGLDILSAIAGGQEAKRYTEVNGQIVEISHMHTGLIASVTQAQGQGALISSRNEIAIVANVNDTVTLPVAVEGKKVIIINNGANTLQIFPASGDDLGAGVDISVTLDSGLSVTYLAIDTINWAKIVSNGTERSFPYIIASAVTLNCNSAQEAMFEPRKISGSTIPIDVDFTLVITGATNTKLISVVFQLTGTRTITMPSDVLVSNASSIGNWAGKPDLVITAGTADIIEFQFLRYSLDSKWLLKVGEVAV